MKYALTLLLGLPLAFAAGWWLRAERPPSATAVVPGGTMAPGVASALGKSAGGAGKVVSPLGALPDIVIRPLTSLKEILAMLGQDGSIEDEAGAGIAMMELMPRLMLTDAATVRAMLEELSGMEGISAEGHKILSMGLMFRWMTVRPEEAIGYSLAHPALLEDSKEMNMLGLIYMAKARPEAARGLAALMPEEEGENINEFLTKLEAASDPGGVLQDPAKSKGMSGDERGRLAARWMRTDPAAAMAWLQGLPEDQRDPEITARVAAARMQSDTAATLAWIGTLPEGPEKASSRARIIDGMLAGVKNPAVFEGKLAGLPSAWQDQARLQWMTQNPPADRVASAEQLKLICTRNPNLAGDLPTRRAINNMAESFTKSGDFNGGASWALTLPDGPAQTAAASTVSQQWTGKDPGAASVWITGLPEGATRDAAATALINEIQREDPTSALVWAQSLSNGNQRRAQTRGVFQAWFRNQPFEALQSIQSLSPEEQRRVFSK